jgi:aldehyde:ferredoxin oxidoreductase
MNKELRPFSPKRPLVASDGVMCGNSIVASGRLAIVEAQEPAHAFPAYHWSGPVRLAAPR